MTASAPESPEARGPEQEHGAPRSRRDDFGELFSVTERRRARHHHGRLVGYAKLSLVTLATGLALLLVIWPQLNPKEAPSKIGEVEGVQEEDLESLRVTRAKLTGINKSGQPYTVTFDDASQTSQEADLVRLTAPQADIELQDGAWITLSSPKGRFHRSKRILELDGDIVLFHDSGMELRTGAITFNLETGTGAGHDPVHAQAPFGSFDAQGFRIRESGTVFHFPGPVRAVFYGVPELGQ